MYDEFKTYFDVYNENQEVQKDEEVAELPKVAWTNH